MDDISPILIALCGLGFVMLGLIFVLGAMLASFASSRIFGPLANVLGALGEYNPNGDADDDKGDRRRSSRSQSQARLRGQTASAQDLRARAQSAQSADIGGTAQSHQPPPSFQVPPPPSSVPSAPFGTQAAPNLPVQPSQPSLGYTQAQPPQTPPPSSDNFDPKQYNLRKPPRSQLPSNPPPSGLPDRDQRRRRDDNEDMLGGLLGNEEEG